MKKTMVKIAVATAFALPMGAQASIYQFNASLNGADERPSPIATTAFGLATLHYDDKGTAASLLDDTFSVAVSGFGLSGAPTGFHIHAAATVNETASVRVNFEFAGHEVIEAPDAEAGIRAATASNPDVIVLDVMPPRKDGFEVLSA